MEAILELDDDIFYKDLSNQISLLIMDDDDDEDSCGRYPFGNSEGFTPSRQLAPSLNSYEHQETTSHGESKGTGVFIPRLLASNRRKKNSKKGRKSTASGNKSRRSCCCCTLHNSVPKKSYTDNGHYSLNLRRSS